MVTDEFSYEQIRQKTYDIIGSADKSSLTVDDITKKVFRALTKKDRTVKKPKRQKSTPLVTKQDMLNSVLNT